MVQSKGTLIIISGPSGTGKDSVLREVFKICDNFKLSVSFTTRNPRIGETDGVDYFFTSENIFLDMVSNNEMLEWTKFCDNYYGTPQKNVIRDLNQGNNIILEIEANGAQQVMKKFPDAISIFLLPPSLSVLEKRLTKRASDDELVITKRIANATSQISFAYNYDYVVVNDDLKECAKNVVDIVKIENMRTKNQKNIIKGVMNNEVIIDK